MAEMTRERLDELRAMFDRVENGKGSPKDVVNLGWAVPDLLDLVDELTGALEDAVQDLRNIEVGTETEGCDAAWAGDYAMRAAERRRDLLARLKGGAA